MAKPPHIVIVGSGLAGYGVLRELRKLSPECELTLITQDEGHFYSKPALSTALAKGKVPGQLITSAAEKMATQLRFNLRSARIVEGISPAEKILLTTGGPLAYDALVLALGGAPIRPRLDGDAAERAVSINHIDDYAAFRENLKPGARVLIMGAGLVGSEFANDFALSGYKITSVDMLAHPLAQLLPAEVGMLLRMALEKEGVTFHFGRSVLAINRAENGASRVTLDDGTLVEADNIISAVGLRPRTQLAEDAGLNVKRGIVVDDNGRTSDPFIYAIGDCAEYPHGTAAYVMPIMAAARAIAPSILGKPAEIRFPTLSVQVKTTTCPMVLLPVPAKAEGGWAKEAGDGVDVKYLFKNPEGHVLGYALTGRFCDERVELDRMLNEHRENRQAA